MSDPLEEFRERAVAFDTETHLFQPGLAAPPLVIASTADDTGAEVLTAEDARAEFTRIMKAEEILVGANNAYDAVVMAADTYREDEALGDELIRLIFEKYDRDEVFDVQIAEALHAIAEGHLGRDPRTNAELRDPATDKRGRYSLSIVSDLVLGREDAKKNDFWRKRYAILERVPVEHWPAEAVQYPRDDARNPLDVALAQVPRNRNLQCMPAQARAAFALALATTWGIRTDKAAVDKLEAEARAEREKHAARWYEAGFVLEGEGKEGADKKAGNVVKRRMAEAYGAKSPCKVCGGTGKILNAKGKSQVICNVKNAGDRFPGLTTCDGAGLDLEEAPLLARNPITEKGGGGGIKAGRDDLAESGDDELMAYAEFQEDDKLFTVYIPYIRKGTEVPINPRANVLLESARTSYDGVIQLFPREGGVRECVIPREGFVQCSTDYSSGELCTFAQVQLWTVGSSRMAEVINETKDPGSLHGAFAAEMMGITLEEFKARLATDKTCKGFRQAAKAGNFGFPGGMGSVKFVLSKRKKAEGFTPSPYGNAVNAKGERGYNGLRFCILIGGAERCGGAGNLVTEWKRKPTAPVCRRCVEMAEQLKSQWLSTWNVGPYFDFVSANVDSSGELCTCPCGMVRGGLSFCDGSNHGFQHLLACGAKRALWYISREMYTGRLTGPDGEPLDRRDGVSPLYGCRLNAFFHDETFGEHPEWNAHVSGPRQAALMVQGLKEFVPDVHVACVPALMRRWSKAAEPAYDTDGKLIVWEPAA